MNNLDIYKQSVNQIFACLDNLDVNLENVDNTNTINNLREYKELAISFFQLISVDTLSNEESDEVVE